MHKAFLFSGGYFCYLLCLKNNTGTISFEEAITIFCYPTRAERRQVQLYAAAEKREFSIKNMILYPREIARLKKEGFAVYYVRPFEDSKDLFLATVEWANAYGPAIPHIVYSYITGIIETKPKKHIENFAQELYVIAHKAQLKKN